MQEVVAHWIAECRLMIDQTRLLTLHAARAMDVRGSRAARKQVSRLGHVAVKTAGNFSCVSVKILFL